MASTKRCYLILFCLVICWAVAMWGWHRERQRRLEYMHTINDRLRSLEKTLDSDVDTTYWYFDEQENQYKRLK